ncbi:MAG: hypothetical protein WCX61_02240 [Candidatus Peribacteraceae bacterium]
MPSPIRQHTFALVIVAATVSAVAISSLQRAQVTTQTEPVHAEIGVEHTLPLALQLDVSVLHGHGLLDVTHVGDENIALSVPEEWKRREVRNVPLQAVTADAPSFGFVRWHLPAGATVSFMLPRYPQTLLLHNPSNVELKVTMARVDLEKNTVERDVILIQNSPVTLW